MRRTLFLLIVGLGGAAILIWLGVWQIQRLAWKEAIIADINTRIAAAPVDLPASVNRDLDAYLPVTVSGTFEQGEVHVLVSQKDVGAGYRIITPFVLEDGRRIMVDRGFAVASAKDAARSDGPATVTGNLQWPQETDSFTPEADLKGNIWFARDVPAMARTLGTQPVLLVTRSSTPPAAGISPLPVDTARIPNDHLQYAITWFSLAAIWLGMSLFFLRRRRAPKTES
ncbi:MAG: SURF1 family protein [Sulfitobacter litoralis]|jgi:surfeit locus 1 family protein|uniref:SURF1-like protein n=2 Tax=root TaxID=1 RepID=A0A7V1A5Z7_9RHOB|nr:MULTISPECIES: SURF1 family protein [Sulfitobacter]MBQ0766781.1 SURF1 family protein [Sulfitobacter litoralis]MCF7726874.1 SURF1 family protein [Sulfitobacter sp. M22]MCF7778252.1 SURF1 family protein [Sulfitobacter sp. M220]HDY95122.1 SURF1 family protein [Sulfitobacter litoralis]HDZ50796.1 SURF1 family protein [Sulfitobacter litoralis]|tara:strand:+ start:193 stop:873 length:681 start_codon:yes stop_codon:yes gene_type:complete